MDSSLNQIKAFVQTYLGYNFNTITTEELQEIKSFAQQAVISFRWEIEDQFTNGDNDEQKISYIRNAQSQLTYLSDSISGFDPERPSQELPEVFVWLQECIFELLDHLRLYFAAFLDFEMQLPADFVARMKSTKTNFDSAEAKAVELAVDPRPIELLDHFSQSTNISERFKIKTWRQWDFLVKTAGVLEHFFKKPPKADINLELLKLFVCRDFNSVQVYGYFLKYVEHITESQAGYEEQKERLLYLVKTFKQVRVEASYAYDQRVPDLKTSFIDGLHAEINYLDEKHQLLLQSVKATNPEAPSKFYFTVTTTLAELMFFFRLLLEVGFIQTKFNSYLYEFVNNHIRTKNAENISMKSQRNLFNNKPFPDKVVLNIRGWLTRMLTHLDLYYKPNY